MALDTIRVGVVGAGANTRGRHIPGLLAIEGIEVVSVCNRSLDSSERVAAHFGIPRVYRHWWELVAADDSDAIVTDLLLLPQRITKLPPDAEAPAARSGDTIARSW